MRDELGFDAAIDHRANDFPERLKDACQKGIDVYFENVGGAVWQAVLALLNNFARVLVCGLVAAYNRHDSEPEQDNLPAAMGSVFHYAEQYRPG